MTEICIVFDRLRSEEKILEKQAVELGHETKMVDAKTTHFDTDSTKQDNSFGDVVLECYT